MNRRKRVACPPRLVRFERARRKGGRESEGIEGSGLPEADADARERPQLPRRFTGGGSCGGASRALGALLGCRDDRGEVLDDSDIGPNGGRGAVPAVVNKNKKNKCTKKEQPENHAKANEGEIC